MNAKTPSYEEEKRYSHEWHEWTRIRISFVNIRAIRGPSFFLIFIAWRLGVHFPFLNFKKDTHPRTDCETYRLDRIRVRDSENHSASHTAAAIVLATS